MSITRTYSSKSTSGFSIGRQSLKIASLNGIATAGNANTNNFLGFYTTTIANASTAVLGLATAPANNAVPVFEIQVTKATNFQAEFAAGLPAIPGPIYLALSSTQGSYTSTTDTVEVFVEMEEWEEQPISALSSATLASGNQLSVWTDTIAAPSAAKALYDVIALDLGNSTGAQLYLQLFGINNANVINGITPLRCWQIPLASGTNNGKNINLTGAILLNFGDTQGGGYIPMSQASNISTSVGANTGINTSACALAISTTSTILTLAAGNAGMIVARYTTPTI